MEPGKASTDVLQNLGSLTPCEHKSFLIKSLYILQKLRILLVCTLAQVFFCDRVDLSFEG